MTTEEQFSLQQEVAARFPRAVKNLGPGIAHLEEHHVPGKVDLEGACNLVRTGLDREWRWAESSARLCEECASLEDCKQHTKPGEGSDHQGWVRVVTLGPYLGGAVKKCHYKKVHDESKEKPWVEKRHSEKTLQGYVVTDKNRPAFTACHQYVRRLEHNLSTGRGLTLSGPTGVGKTHLASAVFHQVMLKAGQTSGAFLYMPDYIAQIKNRFGERSLDASAQAYIEASMGSKFVVLDNLEFRQVTDWLIDTLNRLVDFRYQRCLPTYVTSGWTPERMAEMLEAKLPSRLAEMGEWFVINESDWRRQSARSKGKGRKPRRGGS